MKKFLIIFGSIITFLILIFGTQTALKMYQQIQDNSDSVLMLFIIYILFLSVGVIPLIIGIKMGKK